ncbi:glucose-1-phosphate thymidylyltransferase [Thermodesulfobacteriota bacterium]
MKGLILSGGKGTRLRPLTYTSAKQLMPVANKPILFYGLEAIREAGITDIGIVVGDTKEEIKKEVGDGSRWGVKISYIEQEAPLGLAHAVMVSEEFLGEDPFVMYLGDNIIINGIKALVDEFRANRPNSQILLAHVKTPQQFGVAELNEDKVVRLEEKPDKPKSDLALVGVYMFDNNIMKAVKSIKPSGRGELEITDAIQWMIDNDFEVDPHVVHGWWKDTGKVDDILEANRMILDTMEDRIDGEVCADSEVHFKVVIEKGARIVNSIVRGPAIIGEGTQVINSFIGSFTSISNNCVIENSEIRHSIILQNSVIRDIEESTQGIRIEDSLIGRKVQVSRSTQRPRANRLILGDHSEIKLI